MTKVKITITGYDSNLTVSECEYWHAPGDDERPVISKLLGKALDKVDRAYGLSERRGQDPKAAGE